MKITSASYAYPRLDGESRAAVVSRLNETPIPGALILSTCLRVEVAVAGDDDDLFHVLDLALGGSRTHLAPPQLRRDEEAVTHLYRLAAGLDSPFIGEKEILSQFRQAVIKAGDVADDGLFQKLLEGAVAVGRQVREDVLAASPHASMAAVAAQVVGAADRVAVIGAGTMASAVVEALLGLPAPPEVVVAARHPEKVSVAGVAVWELNQLDAILASFPAVVSVTSAGRQLVSGEALSSIAESRSQTLLLVDLAMPPDFRPPPTPGLVYYDVDRVAAMAVRQMASEEAEAYVAAASAIAYRRVIDHPEVGPLIGEMMSKADEFVEATVDRFAGRLAEPADRDILSQAAHTVARRILAGPVAYLKQPDRNPAAADVAAAMFDIG